MPAEEIKFISAAVGKRTKMGREKPSFSEDIRPRMLRGNWSRISYNKADKRNLVCFLVLFFFANLSLGAPNETFFMIRNEREKIIKMVLALVNIYPMFS